MLPWKLRKRQILPVSQNLSSLYFSLAKFQLVCCNLSLAIIWQMTYTQKPPKLCSATLNQYKFNLDTCFSAGETSKILSSVVFFHTTAWNEKQQQQKVMAERGFDPQTSEL